MTKPVAVVNSKTISYRHHHATATFSARKALTLVVALTILFPYIQLLPISTDIQPNFLLAITLLSPFALKVRRVDLLILFSILFLLLFYTIANPTAASFRAWPAYITPPLVLMFTRAWLLSPSNWPMLTTIMRHAFFVWFGFGVLQLLSGSVIMDLTFRTDTTEDRGWMSLASEPSAYGTVLFLFAAYFMASRQYFLVLIAFLTTLVVAQSAVGGVYFVILAAASLLMNARKKIRLLTILAIALAIFILVVDFQSLLDRLPEGRRITLLIQIAFSSDLHLEDASIESRAGDLILAFDTVINGSPLGNGLDSGIRLKSGWGAYVYELGWVGLALALAWVSYFLRAAARVNRDVLASTLAIVAMLFSSTPLAMPLASFVISALVFAPNANAVVSRRPRRWNLGHA